MPFCNKLFIHVAEHLVADHTQMTCSSNCFKTCEQCCGWRVKVARQQDSPKKKRTRSNGIVSYKYNGPVTNNYYTLPLAPPMAPPITTPTHGSVSSSESSSKSHDPRNNSDRSHDHKCNDGGSHDLQSAKKNSEPPPKREECSSKPPLFRKETFCASCASTAHPTTCMRSLSDSSVTLKQRCNGTSHCSHMTNGNVKPESSSVSQQYDQTTASPDKGDDLNRLAHRLFDVFPYHFIKRHYRGSKKEIVRSFLVIFFIYQALSSALMAICEEGGIRAVFHSGENNCYPELANRLVKFTLRILFRVVVPLCCTLHLPILATTPIIPKTNFSREEAVKILMRIHNQFSSEEEVVLLRNKTEIVVSMSEEMTKRRIRSMWITATHSCLYVFLLLYLGAFYVCEQNTVSGGVCDFLSVTIIHVPFLDINFHIIITTESLTILLNFIIFGVVGDSYNYENRIATYAVIIGGDATTLFKEIRRRWIVMDRLVCAMPLVMGGVLVVSVSSGKPFVSTPIQAVQASDLANWYFWILVLTVLVLLGYSSNRMAKKACIGGYAIAAILIFTVQVKTSHIPYGSIMVLLYTIISAYILNHLYCLSRCYYSNAKTCSGWLSFLTLIFLTLILLVSLFVTIYREIAHFSLFVAW